MRFENLGRVDLAAMEEALREGARIEVALKGPLPRGIRASSLLPLFDSFSAQDPVLSRDLQGFLPPPAQVPAAPYRVTAIIPSNGPTPLGLEALRAQDCDVEVLVLANGGAQPEGDRVVDVAWQGHGPTRQRGVELAEGDYVLFTVNDALPRGAGCVRTLVEALEEGGYDAVFGRQIPWPTSDNTTRERLHTWTPPGKSHRTVQHFDHVFALARRETLLAHPLPLVPIAEDLHWSQGRHIGYVPNAPVAHAHRRQPGALYRRNRDIHVEHLRLGEEPRVPSLWALAASLPGVVKPALHGGVQEIPNQIAELLGQWRAARMTRKQPKP